MKSDTLPPELPNYHFVTQIGKGGFGVVWKVLTVTDKLRALKVVPKSVVSSQVDTVFQLEFRGVKKFEDLSNVSSSLITIYSVGLEEDYFYYVMPLADNAFVLSDSSETKGAYEPLTLDTYLRVKGAFTFDEAITHMLHITEGVSMLHRENLVHRDLNSSNLLFIDSALVVADPGLTENSSKQSQTFSRGFSPPDEEIQPASDVFSLGKIFYHMVTGLQPLDHYPYFSDEVYDSSDFSRIVEIIDRCCSLDSEQRWSDAIMLLQHLKQVSKKAKKSYLNRLYIGLSLIVLVVAGLIFLRGDSQEISLENVRVEGEFLIVTDLNNNEIWRKKLPSSIQEADIVDIDEDGEPEIVCSVKNVTPKGTGRFYVFDKTGVEKWRFDTTMEFQNYPNFGAGIMSHVKYYIEDIDGITGKEIVLQTRNSLNWYPEGLCILSSDGEFRSYYWHPGRIFEDTVIFTKEEDGAPTRIVFTALNNMLGKPFSQTRCHRYIVCMIDPDVRGNHEAPPGKGLLNSQDLMTCWYKILDPQKAQIRSLHVEDYNDDSKQECVVWYEYGSRLQYVEERINRSQIFNFNGESIDSQEGDGHTKWGVLRSPRKEDQRK